MGFSNASIRTTLAGVMLLSSLPLLISFVTLLYVDSESSGSVTPSLLQQEYVLPATVGLTTYVLIFIWGWMIFRRSVFQPVELLQKKVRLIQHDRMTQPASTSLPAEFSDVLRRLHDFNTERLDRDSSCAQQADKLKHRLSKLSGLIKNSPLGIVEWSAELQAVHWNPAAAALLQLDATRPDARSLHSLAISHPNENQALIADLNSLLQHPDEGRISETKYNDDSAKTKILRWHSSAYVNPESQQIHILSLIEDISSQFQEVKALRLGATHDAVTRLPNQILMEQLLANAIDSPVTGRAAVTLMLVDLSTIKLINNTFGFEVGNTVLRQATEKLQGLLRLKDKLGRMSGDELMILLPATDSPRQIEQTARRIEQALQEAIVVDHRPHYLQPKIGIASFPDHGKHAEEIIRKALIALNAVETGTDQTWKVFDPALEQETQHRLTVESDLRQALENKELELYLQPLVTIRDERLWGAEALIRWHHPEKGLIYPADFIPYAEESCLTLEISHFVLERAHRMAADWSRSGHENLTLSINLSPRQFADPKLSDNLMELQRTHAIAPGQLIIEITEDTLLSTTSDSLEKIKLLKALGYRVALDDFGIGYASMNQFTQFPLDIVKIHRSYIAEAVVNPGARAMVTSIIQMAKRLGVKAIAEGVENESEQKILSEESCDVLQGYLFGKAIPPSEFKSRYLKSPKLRKSRILSHS